MADNINITASNLTYLIMEAIKFHKDKTFYGAHFREDRGGVKVIFHGGACACKPKNVEGSSSWTGVCEFCC
jgi:hypothetical protein